MPAFQKSALAGSIIPLAMLAALSLPANAAEQTRHRPVHHKVHSMAQRQPDLAPLAPGFELGTSTYADQGSENHYYSDTVAAGHSDLLDLTYRYGQSPTTRYNSAEPLFRF